MEDNLSALHISGEEDSEKWRGELLTPAMVDQFIRDGYVVVPNVFSPLEVAELRHGLHETMARTGVRHGMMTAEEYKRLPRFGVQTQIFYPPWKMHVQVGLVIGLSACYT